MLWAKKKHPKRVLFYFVVGSYFDNCVHDFPSVPVVPEIQPTISDAPNIIPIPIAVATAKGHDNLPRNSPMPSTTMAIVATALPIAPCNAPTIVHNTLAIASPESLAAKDVFGIKELSNIAIQKQKIAVCNKLILLLLKYSFFIFPS